MRPTSRGHVALTSADPRDPIQIHQNFLETPEEWETMRRGLRMARELVASPQIKEFGGEEILPGADKTSDSEIDTHIRATMGTVHHPVGTCKMGVTDDPFAVVDAELRVRGVDGLRVVDASVMPDLIGGATNAPVIMIAEKVSDLIRGRSPLPAASV